MTTTSMPTLDRQEGWDLVEAAQTGDVDAFARIYQAHFTEVLAMLLVRTHDRFRAEEFASETFLRAFRQIKTLTYQGRSVRAWLMTIAKNLVLDDLRSARRRHEVFETVVVDRAADDPDPELIACSRDVFDRVAGCIRGLPSDQRRCVVYRFIQELSVVETAQRMGRSPEAVRALQARARRRLVSELGGDRDEVPA